MRSAGDVEVRPAAELPLNVSVFEMGNLGLSSEEEAGGRRFHGDTDGWIRSLGRFVPLLKNKATRGLKVTRGFDSQPGHA